MIDNVKNRRVDGELELQGFKQTDKASMMHRFVDNVSPTNYMN